jgi:hypothetical protein
MGASSRAKWGRMDAADIAVQKRSNLCDSLHPGLITD